MKPIQFRQNKKDMDWGMHLSCPNTSYTTYLLKQIRNGTPILSQQEKRLTKPQKLSTSKMNRATATLLAEYYSILFNPHYRKFFWPLTDLSLLFPVDEDIYISKTTNFILLPLPLPTYKQHTQGRNNGVPFRKKHPCPFLIHTPLSDEAVHDMDYYQDNTRVMAPRISSDMNIKLHNIQHTNPDIKHDRQTNLLDRTARIRVYKYDDIPAQEASTLPTYPKYSMKERQKIFQPVQPEFASEPLKQDETSDQRIQKIKANYNLQRANFYTQRQYTFLEITPFYMGQDENAIQIYDEKMGADNLRTFSKKYLSPTQLTVQFAECFDFETPTQEEIVAYFMDNISCVEYSPLQIKGGIRKLKNIIKYKKTIKSAVKEQEKYELTSPQPTTQPSQPQPKFNQHIRSLNIKQADGTYKVQMIEDFNITDRTGIDDIKPLLPNQ